MPISLDTTFYKFQCPSPMCARPFQRILRTLIRANKVACPYCGAEIDIRQSKSIGPIGNALEKANERQASQKGTGA
jgi:hypothetical protein